MTQPANAKTPNIDRRTFIIAVAIVVAAIAGIFAVSLATHHSAPAASSATINSATIIPELSAATSPEERLLINDFNSGEFGPGAEIVAFPTMVTMHWDVAHQLDLVRVMRDLGFRPNAYRAIVFHGYVDEYDTIHQSSSDYSLYASRNSVSITVRP